MCYVHKMNSMAKKTVWIFVFLMAYWVAEGVAYQLYSQTLEKT